MCSRVKSAARDYSRPVRVNVTSPFVEGVRHRSVTPVAGAGRAAARPSASADTVPDHLPGVDDLVEPLLVDVAGLERGLLQGQAFVIRLVRDGGSLV